MDDDGNDLLDGDGTTADYLLATGGSGSPYVQNQTVYDASDNGTLTATGSATNGTATSNTPAWLSAITGLSGTATALQKSGIINGQPSGVVTNPAAPAVAATSTNTWLIIGILAAIIGYLFLGKKRRA